MKSRPLTSLTIALVLTTVFSSQGQGSPGWHLQPSRRCSERLLFRAINQINSKNYDVAVLLLKSMDDAECPLMPAATLLVADCYFRQRGQSNLSNAERGYGAWLESFPDHQLAPQVMKKLAEVYMKSGLTGGNRDSGNGLVLAYRALSRLQEKYPEFREDLEVQQYTIFLEEFLALHELKCAIFYAEV